MILISNMEVYFKVYSTGVYQWGANTNLTGIFELIENLRLLFFEFYVTLV